MKLGKLLLKSIAIGAVCSTILATSGCVSKSKYDAEVQKANNYEQLNAQLRSKLSADEAQIQVMQNELKVTMVNQVLFPEGGWTLGKQGEEALAKIAPTLAKLPKDQQIIIEGFTDNVPLSDRLKERFPSNIELSSARAGAVLRYLAAKGVPENIMSAQGFGDSRAVASNATEEGRAQNRRVEIIITSANRP